MSSCRADSADPGSEPGPARTVTVTASGWVATWHTVTTGPRLARAPAVLARAPAGPAGRRLKPWHRDYVRLGRTVRLGPPAVRTVTDTERGPPGRGAGNLKARRQWVSRVQCP
jgi:hypothetical protein